MRLLRYDYRFTSIELPECLEGLRGRIIQKLINQPT